MEIPCIIMEIRFYLSKEQHNADAEQAVAAGFFRSVRKMY